MSRRPSSDLSLLHPSSSSSGQPQSCTDLLISSGNNSSSSSSSLHVLAKRCSTSQSYVTSTEPITIPTTATTLTRPSNTAHTASHQQQAGQNRVSSSSSVGTGGIARSRQETVSGSSPIMKSSSSAVPVVVVAEKKVPSTMEERIRERNLQLKDQKEGRRVMMVDDESLLKGPVGKGKGKGGKGTGGVKGNHPFPFIAIMMLCLC